MATYKSIPQLVETNSPNYNDFLIIHGSGLTKKIQLQNTFPGVSGTDTIDLKINKQGKSMSADINPGSINNNLLSAMNPFTFKGRIQNFSGSPEDLTLNQVRNLLSINELSSNVQILSSTSIRKFATNIGDGVLTAFDVSHNLNTRDVITQIYSNTNFLNVSAFGIQNLNTDTVSLSFDFIPLNDELRVVVMG